MTPATSIGGERIQRGLVSIVTPCYNALPYVAETIESVCAQTYEQIEHLIIDDASTDGSWDAIRLDRRVRSERLERNGGGARARNRGAALARGEYLMFLDADDVIRPDTVAALVEAAGTEGCTIAVGPWCRLAPVEDRWDVIPAEISFPPPADALRGWLEGVWVPTCSVLWRREAFDLTGGWDEALSLNDDGDLMMRALVDGARVVATSSGEGLYRSLPPTRERVSAGSFSEEKLRMQTLILERIADRLDRRGRLARYRVPLAIAYHRLGLTALQAGHATLAREFIGRGRAFGGRQAVSVTQLGRALDVLIGLEWKERVATALARVGVQSAGRKRVRQRFRSARERHGGAR